MRCFVRPWFAFAVLMLASHNLTAQQNAPEDAAARRAAFLRVIDRPRVPLSPHTTRLSATPTVREHFTFVSEAGQTVPGLLQKPGSVRGRAPAVILLHGTGGSKEDARVGRMSEQLVARGIIAVAIDGRYHGERAAPGARSTEYVDAIFRAYEAQREHPFLYDTVWDVIRLVDYLHTRKDVDSNRIGAIGISKGGMETYLAAAADPRIAVAVPVIGVQSFQWAIENDAWQPRVSTFQSAVDRAAAREGVTRVTADFIRKFYNRVVPGIHGDFDAPAMLPLIAPRPLLVINGDSDPRTPLAGVQQSAEAAEARYRALNASEHFRLLLQPNTGHAFTDAAEKSAVEWLVRWLTRKSKGD